MIEFDSAIDYCEVNTCRKDHITMHVGSSYFTPFRGGRFICLLLSAPLPLFVYIYIYTIQMHLTKFRCSKEMSKRGEIPIFGLFSVKTICSPVFGILAQISFFEDCRDWALRLRPLCTVPGECRLCSHQSYYYQGALTLESTKIDN